MSLIHSLWLAFSDLEMAEISFDDFAAKLEAGSTPMAKKSIKSVLIQLGDVIDRGPDGLACLEILDGIEKTIGWTTVSLYGNHELMSHLGKSDAFIADEEREIFADRFGSVDARITEFQSGGSVWSKIVEKSLLLARTSASDTSMNTLFVHGGVELHWVDQIVPLESREDPAVLVDALNRITYDLIQSESAFKALLEERQSPLWVRDLAEIHPEYVCLNLLPRILKRFKVARVIVGHTPQTDLRMKSLCNSRLILADASMSAWMREPPSSPLGNPCALVMRPSSVRALYLDHQDVFQRESDTEKAFFAPARSPMRLSQRREIDPDLGLMRIKVEQDSIGQQMAGKSQYNLLSRLPKISGVAKILYQSELGPDPFQQFYVIMDVDGLPLLDLDHVLTLSLFRQILEIINALFNAGFRLLHSSTAANDDPVSILASFFFLPASGLVKLVDLKSLRPLGSLSLRSAALSILEDLRAITQLVLCERIDWTILSLEVFGQDFFAQDQESIIAKWNILQLDLIHSTSASSFFTAVFDPHTSLIRKQNALILQTDSHAGPFIKLVSARGSWFPGIPSVLAIQEESDENRFFICFDLSNVVMLSSAHKSLSPDLLSKVVSQLLHFVDCLHVQDVILALPPDPSLAMTLFLSLFALDPSTYEVWLVDIAHARIKPGLAETVFKTQLFFIIKLIKIAFPSVEVEVAAEPDILAVDDDFIDQEDESETGIPPATPFVDPSPLSTIAPTSI